MLWDKVTCEKLLVAELVEIFLHAVKHEDTFCFFRRK
jgi:hypothetical protein